MLKQPSNILFVAEPDTDVSTSLKLAIRLANNSQAKLTVAGVFELTEADESVLFENAESISKSIVEEQIEQLRSEVQKQAGSNSGIETKLLRGRAYAEIIRDVLMYRRDLVVTTNNSRAGIAARLFGSTEKKLLRMCPCPVWSIKASQESGPKTILVALDHDPENPENDRLNREILNLAGALALANFSQLHILHAWRLRHESFMRSHRSPLSSAEVDARVNVAESDCKRWLQTLVDDCFAESGKSTVEYLNPNLHLIQGHARRIVPESARSLNADLIVMGTVARTGVEGLMIGNTAEAILDQVDCSVLAAKPSSFVSPITLSMGP